MEAASSGLAAGNVQHFLRTIDTNCRDTSCRQLASKKATPAADVVGKLGRSGKAAKKVTPHRDARRPVRLGAIAAVKLLGDPRIGMQLHRSARHFRQLVAFSYL